MRDVAICPGRTRWSRPFLALALVGFFCLSAGTPRAQDGAEPLTIGAPRTAVKIQAGKSGAVTLTLSIGKGWHVFGAEPLIEGVKGLRVTLTGAKGVTVFPVKLPAPRRVNMPALGKEGNVYEGPVKVVLPIKADPKAAPGSVTLEGVLQYQACSDAACRLPKKLKFTVPIQVVK